MSRSSRALSWTLLVVALSLIACATSPTGRRQVVLNSAPQMAGMGVAAFAELRSQLPRSTNAGQTTLVRCVAHRITAVLTPEELRPIVVDSWEVELFEDPTANAFALPGGKMGVHTGLLNVATTPDQLAAVLGHEVGHVLARHGNERVSQTTLAQVGLTAVAVFAGSDSPEKRQLMAALGVGAQLGIMTFSRTHESEADLIGLMLMARAGFDPREATTLWQNMAAASESQGPPEFLSTHPSHATRISRLRAATPRAMAFYDEAVASGRRATCR